MPFFKGTFILLFGIVICGIITLGILTIRSDRAFEEDVVIPSRNTREMILESERVLSMAKDPIPSPTILEKIQRLKYLTRNNTIEQPKIDSLQNCINWLIHPPAKDGQLALGQKENVNYIDIISGIVTRIQKEESRLLQLHQDAGAKHRAEQQRLLLSILTGILLLTTALFWFISYHFSKRKKADAQLKESEGRFRLLIKNVKDYAIFTMDPKGYIISTNEGVLHIEGYTEEEVVGRHISIFYTAEDIRNEVPKDNLRKAAAVGRYESVGWRKKKDGTLFWADVTYTALYNDRGEPGGFVKITRDLTEEKKAEEETAGALRREKELNEMKSRFVSLASHEFKTPLSVILSSASLVGKYAETAEDPRINKHIYRIKSNVNNLKQILNDFLSVEKLESGILINTPSQIDLPHWIPEIVQDMDEAFKPGQRIDWKIEGDPTPVLLDAQILRNILNNLLSNAIKYSPENSPIELTIHFDHPSLQIRVKDYGIGIPAEERTHLFERFFRAANTTGIPGTGLGLSIVKKYLDLMDGSITVDTAVGKGTLFTVSLPLETGTQPSTLHDQYHTHH